MQSNEKKVFQFNMEEMREAVFGELWCKALLVALFSLRAEPRLFAFYNCSQQFMDQFKEDMGAFFRGTEGCNPLNGNPVQISLFLKNEIDGLIFFPASREDTWYANEQLCRSRGIPNQLAWLNRPGTQPKEELGIAPLEVICEPEEDGLTLFELYTKRKLENSIQGQELGCKIEHTHMRLGSAVHICTFYEAELLFSNSLFYSRFAFLLLRELRPKLQQLPQQWSGWSCTGIPPIRSCSWWSCSYSFATGRNRTSGPYRWNTSFWNGKRNSGVQPHRPYPL